ncbi:MAG TPA: hypothetical protein H9684_02140 [Firmicutes bacterium]|nr:hypothetical protein [Bacillota bacterium]
MSKTPAAGSRAAQYRRILRENPPMYRAVQNTPPPPRGDTAGVVCRYVLAPALGGFVRWLVHAALKSGKQRLYFLARDGYFFYYAARIYCKIQGLPLDCRYLYGSRYALRVPLFHRDREAALDFICRDGLHVTPARLLGRAGLDDEDCRQVLTRLGLPYAAEERIPPPVLPTFRRALRDCGAFWEAADRRSRQALPGLAGYLRQEGLLEDVPCALVDSGWTGSMQKSLGDALSLLGRSERPEGYYWGLYELPAGVRRADYHCYYFPPEGRLREKALFNNCLFEAVFTAPHGMTVGYREAGGACLPVLGPAEEAACAFAERLEPLLLGYIRQLAEAPGTRSFAADRETIGRLLGLFMASPTRREAEAFGRLPFSDDVLADAAGSGVLAAPLTERELTAGHLFPRLLAAAGLREGGPESAWYEGSAVRAGRRAARHLRQYRLYQYARHLRAQRTARRAARQAPPR